MWKNKITRCVRDRRGEAYEHWVDESLISVDAGVT